MELTDFTFPVEERSLYEVGHSCNTYKKIEGYKGIYKTGTDKLISVVNRNYKLCTNQEIFDHTLAVFDKNNIKYILDPISSMCTDSKMRCHIWFPQHTFDDGESKIFLSMFIQNSYDMSTTFRFNFGAYRLICLNGAFIFYKQLATKVTHKHTQGFYVNNLIEDIDAAIKTFPIFQKKIEDLKEAPIVIHTIKKTAIGIMGKEFNKYMEQNKIWDSLKTYYDLYNELTFYATHKVAPAQRNIYFEKISRTFKM